ncbi:hypothetical protein ACFL2A_05270 [Thermodesulfobacteriota bacterium]
MRTKINLKNQITTALFIVMILFVSLASAKEIEHKKLTAMGEVVIKDNNSVAAREKAIKIAMLNAVENAVSLYVTSASIALNAPAIKEKIYSKSERYLESFTIISENSFEKVDESEEAAEEESFVTDKPEGEVSIEKETVYSVTIEAYVFVGNIKNDLISLGILSKDINLPRFALFISQRNIETDKYEYWWSNDEETFVFSTLVEDEIERRFFELGLRSAAKEPIFNNLKEEFSEYGSDIHMVDAIYLAKKAGAEIVIVGRALPAIIRSGADKKMMTAIANINLRLLDINGNVIASEVVSEQVDFFEDEPGADEAIKKASIVVADRLMEEIVDDWGEEEQEVASVSINVSGLTKNTYLNFVNLLKDSIRGASNVMPRSFKSGGKASFTIDVKGGSAFLINELAKVNLQTLLIEIVSSSEDSIDVVLTYKALMEN